MESPRSVRQALCTFGRTGSTSTFAWKTRKIKGNVCRWSWARHRLWAQGADAARLAHRVESARDNDLAKGSQKLVSRSNVPSRHRLMETSLCAIIAKCWRSDMTI